MKKFCKLLLFPAMKKKGYGVSGYEEEDKEERLRSSWRRRKGLQNNLMFSISPATS
jgi:ribosomal protein L32E